MNRISALESEPEDHIRRVEPGVLSYYVNDLSGLYLPDSFTSEHINNPSVNCWKPEDRLHGKFGRFIAQRYISFGRPDPAFNPIQVILMGTTIDLGYDEHLRRMSSLRHYVLDSKVMGIIRDSAGEDGRLGFESVDYGSTTIKLDKDGEPVAVDVYGQSFDFGRADTEGRRETCELFQALLGDSIQVVNVNPEPIVTDQIIR